MVGVGGVMAELMPRLVGWLVGWLVGILLQILVEERGNCVSLVSSFGLICQPLSPFPILKSCCRIKWGSR